MTELLVSESAVTRAVSNISTWHEAPQAQHLIDAIIGAHFLSCSLPAEVRQHIGYLEGRAVRRGLAHGWGYDLTPHGGGVLSAWEGLKAVREDAIEMAMREAGCAPYSWFANPELFFQLGETAPTIEQIVGNALVARNSAFEKEAA